MSDVYGDWITVAELARRERVSPQYLHGRLRRYGGVLKLRPGPRRATLVHLGTYERIFGKPGPAAPRPARAIIANLILQAASDLPTRPDAHEVLAEAILNAFADPPELLLFAPADAVPADPPAPIADRQRGPRELFGEAVTLFSMAARGAFANVWKHLARISSIGLTTK